MKWSVKGYVPALVWEMFQLKNFAISRGFFCFSSFRCS